MSAIVEELAPEMNPRVTRSRRGVWWMGIVALVVVAVFAILPYEVYSGTTAILDQAFVILTLAGCTQVATGSRQAPASPYSRETGTGLVQRR